MTTIAFVLEKVIRGGGEMLLSDVFDELDDRYSVEVWNLGRRNQAIVERFEEVGATVVQLGQYGTADKYLLRPLPAVVATCRRRSVDALQGSSLYTNLLVKAAGLAVGVPAVGQIHGVPASQCRPVVLAEAATNRLADIAVTNSRTAAAEVYGADGSVRRALSGGRIERVPCGIDMAQMDRFSGSKLPISGPGSEIPKGRQLVVSVGRLIPLKNQATLIRALARLDDDTHLVLIGGGPQEEALRALAADLGIADRTTFLGNVPRETVLSVVSNASVSVSVSRREGFGIAVIEALALSVPVVVSDIGTYREVLAEPEGGLSDVFVDQEDSTAVANAVEALLDDPQRRRAVARAGRELVADEYAIDAVASRYARLYQALL